MPKISIIIPLYNKEESIIKSIDSILQQDFNDYEIVVVNDGSTDKSLDMVNSIVDKRITIISQKNGGVSAARNRGIREASGEYLCFLDADDMMPPHTLSAISKCITANYDLIVGQFEIIYRNNMVKVAGKPYREGVIDNQYKRFFKQQTIMRTGSFYIKRKIALQCLFNTENCRYEDLEAYLAWVGLCGSIYFLRQPVYQYITEYKSLSIPSLDIFVKDYSTKLDFSDHNFYLNCCKGQLLLNAYYSYPSMRTTLIRDAGIKGAIFGFYAFLWSIRDELKRKYNNMKFCNRINRKL